MPRPDINPPVDDTTRRRVVAAYKAGCDPKALQGRFGFHYKKIMDILHDAGVDIEAVRTAHSFRSRKTQ